MKYPKMILLFTIVFSVHLHADLPHSFYNGIYQDLDNANAIALLGNNHVFVSCGDDGLKAFSYNGNSFAYKSFVDDGGQYWDSRDHLFHDIAFAYDALVLEDSTIILANGEDGTRAYDYGSASGFTCLDSINDGSVFGYGRAMKHTAYNDSIILLANHSGGLRAYAYQNKELFYKDKIDKGGDYNGVCVAPDGTIFVANSTKGLCMYNFKGSSFYYKGSCYDGGVAQDVGVSENGIVFLAKGDDGLGAYSYRKDLLQTYHIADIEVNDGVTLKGLAIVSDNRIAVAANNGGISIYAYKNDEFSFEAWINSFSSSTYGDVLSVASINDSTIVAAHSWHGISVWDCDYNDRFLYHLDNIYNNGRAKDVKVNDDGVIFAATTEGLRAYRFTDSLRTSSPAGDGDNMNAIDISENGTIFTANDDGTIKAYEFTGTGFRFKASGIDYDGYKRTEDVSVLNDSIVFVARETGGLYAYAYNGTKFTEIAHELVDDFSYSVAVHKDSTIALGCNNSVYVYKFTGTELLLKDTLSSQVLGMEFSDEGVFFNITEHDLGAKIVDGYYVENIAQVNSGGFAEKVSVFNDNLVFLSRGSAGMTAYTFDYSEFYTRAHRTLNGDVHDIAISADSTLFVVAGSDGIYSFAYSGYDEAALIKDTVESSIDVIEGFSLTQNYPNPFNPTTTISYQLPTVNDVEVSIYDISGREIKQWSYQNQIAGAYEITWNGIDQRGDPVPSGVYIYRMVAGDFVQSKKMVLLK
jgi:FlgD Ig-like domain